MRLPAWLVRLARRWTSSPRNNRRYRAARLASPARCTVRPRLEVLEDRLTPTAFPTYDFQLNAAGLDNSNFVNPQSYQQTVNIAYGDLHDPSLRSVSSTGSVGTANELEMAQGSFSIENPGQQQGQLTQGTIQFTNNQSLTYTGGAGAPASGTILGGLAGGTWKATFPDLQGPALFSLTYTTNSTMKSSFEPPVQGPPHALLQDGFANKVRLDANDSSTASLQLTPTNNVAILSDSDYNSGDYSDIPAGVTDTFTIQYGGTYNWTLTAEPDALPTSLHEDASQGGVDFSYKVVGQNMPKDTKLALFWSVSPQFTGIISSANYSLDIPAGTIVGPHFPFHVSADTLGQAPQGAKYLLAVTDPSNTLGYFDDSLNVLATPVPITFSPTPSSLPPAIAGVPYSQTITASGGIGDKTVTETTPSGSVLTGLNFTSSPNTLTISGTPTAHGPALFDVTATDSMGDTFTQHYALTTFFLGNPVVDSAGDHAIFRTDSSSGQQIQTNGVATNLAAADSTIYALDAAKNVSYWNGQNFVPATTQISFGGSVYFLGKAASDAGNYTIYRFDANGHLANTGGAGVALGLTDGVLWTVNAANQVFRYDSSGNTWVAAQPPAVNVGGNTYFLGTATTDSAGDYTVYRFGSDGKLTSTNDFGVSLGIADGTVWTANAFKDVFHYDAGSNTWTVAGSQAADPGGNVFFTGNTTVDAGGDYNVYDFSPDGQLNQTNSPGLAVEENAFNAQQVFETEMINSSGSVFGWGGSSNPAWILNTQKTANVQTSNDSNGPITVPPEGIVVIPGTLAIKTTGLDVGSGGTAVVQGNVSGPVTDNGGAINIAPGASVIGDLAIVTGDATINGSVNGTVTEGGTETNTGESANVGGDGVIAALKTLSDAFNFSIQAGISPGFSPGRLTVGELVLNSAAKLQEQIYGPLAGSSYDQLKVTGSASLGGATLSVDLGKYQPPLGQQFVILDNQGTNPINGTFKDLPEGGTLKVGNTVFRISYKGGDGNDVTLTAQSGTSSTPPTVTGIAPNSGLTSGGTSVTISGSEFTGATAVTFGTTPATSFHVVNDNTITAIAPAHGAGAVGVKVTAPGGSSTTGALADQFTYVAAGTPFVTGLSINAGPTSGGALLYVQGRGFTGATNVTFDGAHATFFVFSDNMILVFTPAHAAGTVDVKVTNRVGTSIPSSADQYTYQAAGAPSVISLSPSSGPAVGGNTVTIHGCNFNTATDVTFGGTSAHFTKVNNTNITATAPAGAGTVDVVVVNPGGPSATRAADRYTFVAAPTVTGVNPASGPLVGGNTVTITGTGFTGAAAVNFGTTPASSFTVVNSTTITARVPAASAAGPVNVTVVTAGGTSGVSPLDQYTYVSQVPTVTSLSPVSGPTGGGTVVTINGSGFTDATGVKFGANAATNVTVLSDSQIQVTAPAGTGTVPVTVTGPAGTSAQTPADQFTYVTVPAPSVTGVSPNSGATGGGTRVTITGTSFTGATAVTFNGVKALSFTVNSDGRITATSPSGTGIVDVQVTTAGGPSTTSTLDHFTYVAAGTPMVSSLSSTSGPSSGGSLLLINGSGFTSATSVKFDTVNARFFVLSNNLIMALTPPHAAGRVDVIVTNSVGASVAGQTDRYTYN